MEYYPELWSQFRGHGKPNNLVKVRIDLLMMSVQSRITAAPLSQTIHNLKDKFRTPLEPQALLHAFTGYCSPLAVQSKLHDLLFDHWV